MPASNILKEVYKSHLNHFGEPDNSWVFDDGKIGDIYPNRIDVFVWAANAECDITTYSTIGMSDRKMAGAAHRAELHFALRRKPADEDHIVIARFLANLAMYPFQISAALDWWHTVSEPGTIPFFSDAKCALFHPRFVSAGWDTIVTSEAEVRILNVIPITKNEKDLKSRTLIADALSTVDMFSPR